MSVTPLSKTEVPLLVNPVHVCNDDSRVSLKERRSVSLMSSKSETRAPTRRERVRAATIEEIKATALRLMHDQGSADLRFSDIAREMGMTAPALYRYFSDRDALLSALVADAYNDL